MITMRRITEPVPIACPHCAAPIMSIEEHTSHSVISGRWIGNPESIEDLHESLSPHQLKPSGFHCFLESGTAKCCNQSFFIVEAVMVNRDVNDKDDYAFISTYFFLNYAAGERSTNMMASRGKREWPVQRFDSRHGPVLHHFFGPFKTIEMDVIMPDGTIGIDRTYGNMDYARRILLALWDDLRTLAACTH